jgi:transitional endoplasmic reticulum ATPase
VDENGLILNPTTEFELKANVFTLIEQTEACKKNKIPLKHGCLLMGPFGTGKTLCAQVTASKCVRNGWTFIYLKNCRHLAHGLRMAQLYAPAVVFTEDIDQAPGNGMTRSTRS